MPASATDGPSIPSINVVVEQPSTPVLVSPPTSNVGSSHTQHTGLLSPYTQYGRVSFEVPPSPVGSDNSDVSLSTAPPSPTISTHSTQHLTTMVLRNNHPDQHSGVSSLGLLDPRDSSELTHARKDSNATFTSSNATDVDPTHSDPALRRAKSNSTFVSQGGSVTATNTNNNPTRDSSTGSDGESNRRRGNRDAEKDTRTAHEVELAQDAAIDPAPFKFKPYELAHMLDPKDMSTLTGFGGIDGLLRGLGTDVNLGLSSKQSLPRTATGLSQHSGDGRPGAGVGASHRHDPEKQSGETEKERIPEITLTEPGGLVAVPAENNQDGPAFGASLEDRRRIYGGNLLPQRASKSLLQLMWLALKDKVLVLLSIAAIISLALGFFQDFGTKRESDEPPVDWVEGVAIMVAIAIVVIVGSLNDWQKERQFRVLNEKKEERGVKVIRDGVEKVVDIKEVVVGDIALLEPGEIVPCDGIFLSGHNVKCDESGATGESDAIKKQPYNDLFRQQREGKDLGSAHTDCFIVSGSKVLEGVGKYVIVAVGQKSFNGRIMMALRGDAENTPLQLKLNDLAELIAKIGSAAGLLLFTALMIRFFVQLGKDQPHLEANQKGIAFVNILIISVTLIVVAVPEGLPLAVTLALAFATKRMTYEKLLVRVLGSCETMANASVVCTDKTGTLTQNSMTVVAGSIGIHAKFVRQLDDNAARSNAEEENKATRKHHEDFSVDQAQLNKVLSPQLQHLFNEAIAVNSSAFQDKDPETNEPIFVGSKTETALLQFAKELEWSDFQKTRDNADVVQMVPFSSERKSMAVVIRLGPNQYRLYAKGASEILSKKCTRHVVVHKPGYSGDEKEVETCAIDKLAEENISRTIIFYANQTLRTIALCYKDFDSWPPEGMQHDEQNEVPYDDLAQELILIGITGIEDPLRVGVTDAVAKCHRAGVTVKMVTGDNVLTARSIASQCGIFTKGGIIMEGPVFRKLNHKDMVEIVPRLQVLARSSPEDKKILVETLKSIGEIVGVTGDGTNDGPALKTAHVGFSMGIAGTEVAKEASDIILMDDNFSSIVKAIMWGRCVNDAVRKFLQFQISTNVTAVIITFVSAVASDQEESVLSAVQLLWINIIMDTFAALALATDPATEVLLNRKPDKKTSPLFTVDMYKMILMQSVYQVIVILIFHFLGHQILGLDHSAHNDVVVKTLVFNAFVFAQIFNSVNCRRLDNKLNIFEGIINNYYFMTITLLEIAVQVIIVFVGGAAFQVTPIPGREWGISLALGIVSIPWGAVIRCMPNGPFEKLFKAMRLLGREEVLPTTRPDAEGWSGAITLVRDNLSTFANIRGGRLRSSSFVVRSRSARLADDKALRMSSVLTMAPTLMAGTIATGQAYFQAGSLSDPAHTDPSTSSAALWEGKIQLHPDTSPEDEVYKRFIGGQPNV